MLYRKIESLIEEHLKSDSKKILLIDGARQIGKTYIINYVGNKLFENYIEINMIEDSLGDRLFENTKTVEDFYLQVSMLAGNKMRSKENTLIFIDEIQAYPCLLYTSSCQKPYYDDKIGDYDDLGYGIAVPISCLIEIIEKKEATIGKDKNFFQDWPM